MNLLHDLYVSWVVDVQDLRDDCFFVELVPIFLELAHFEDGLGSCGRHLRALSVPLSLDENCSVDCLLLEYRFLLEILFSSRIKILRWRVCNSWVLFVDFINLLLHLIFKFILFDQP